MSFYDINKEVEQTEKVESLEKANADISAKLNDMSESDAEWTPERDSEYARLQLKHGEIHREMKYEKSKLDAMLAIKPAEQMPVAEKNEHLEEFAAFIHDGKAGASFDLNLFDAFSTISPQAIIRGDNSSAADTINTSTVATVIDRLDSFGFEANVPAMIVTPDGSPMKFPLADNTGSAQVGTRRAAQGQAVTEQDMADFTDVELKVDTIDAKRFQIPRELLQDSVFSMEGYAMNQLMRRINVTLSQNIWSGTGNIQGIKGVANVEAITASSGFVFLDESVDLEHSVPRAYFRGEGPLAGAIPAGSGLQSRNGFKGYLMSREMEALLKKTKDDDGRPLWTASMTGGFPDQILGWPYLVLDSMDAPGTGAAPIAFGNFDYAIGRMVGTLEVVASTDSATLRNNAREYTAFLRYGQISALKPDGSSKNEAFSIGQQP